MTKTAIIRRYAKKHHVRFHDLKMSRGNHGEDLLGRFTFRKNDSRLARKDGTLTAMLRKGASVKLGELNAAKYRKCQKCGGLVMVGLAKRTGLRGCDYHQKVVA